MIDAYWGTLLSAVAASTAAVLAGLNLWLTGRRSQVSWARSALEEAFVDFLTAFCDHKVCAREIANLKVNRSSHKTETECQLRAEEPHDVMMNCVTRCRMLAADEMGASRHECGSV